MYRSIINFSENINYFNLILFAVTSAAISLSFNFEPILQFISTASLVIIEIILLEKLELGKELLNKFFILIQLSKILLAAGNKFFTVIAVFLILINFLAVLRPFFENKGYFLGFFAHLSDLITTKVAITTFNEANPLMNYLMNSIGVDKSLGVMKVFLMSFLLTYSWKFLEGAEENLFLNSMVFIGFSMAARNLLIIF
jgi:hypothetical protein